jgi:hypothetical protein
VPAGTAGGRGPHPSRSAPAAVPGAAGASGDGETQHPEQQARHQGRDQHAEDPGEARGALPAADGVVGQRAARQLVARRGTELRRSARCRCRRAARPGRSR